MECAEGFELKAGLCLDIDEVALLIKEYSWFVNLKCVAVQGISMSRVGSM